MAPAKTIHAIAITVACMIIMGFSPTHAEFHRGFDQNKLGGLGGSDGGSGGCFGGIGGRGPFSIPCLSPVTSSEGCIQQITSAFLRAQPGLIGSACCEAFLEVEDSCLAKAFPLIPFFTPMLKNFCSILAPPNVPAAPQTPPVGTPLRPPPAAGTPPLALPAETP